MLILCYKFALLFYVRTVFIRIFAAQTYETMIQIPIESMNLMLLNVGLMFSVAPLQISAEAPQKIPTAWDKCPRAWDKYAEAPQKSECTAESSCKKPN